VIKNLLDRRKIAIGRLRKQITDHAMHLGE